jgi:hypothetical protein
MSWRHRAIEEGWVVKPATGRFATPYRSSALNVQEAALLCLSAQLYISFTSTERRLLAESNVDPSVEGQVQPRYTRAFHNVLRD